MKIGTIDIIKAYFGEKSLTHTNAYMGTNPVIEGSEPEPTYDGLCFTALEDSTVYLTQIGTPDTYTTYELYTSTDGTNWTTYTLDDVITIAKGSKLYWKGNNTAMAETPWTYKKFVMTGSIAASGNTYSLLGTDTLVEYALAQIFYNCTSLTTAPTLSATEIAASCYKYMFNGCTALTTAPELPATILEAECYFGMFGGCSSLNYIKCDAYDISASDCVYGWVEDVASTGTFVENPAATWTTGVSGIPDGWTVEKAEGGEFCLTALEDGYISMWQNNTPVTANNIQYKLNSGDWTDYTMGNSITVTTGDKVYWKGDGSVLSEYTGSTVASKVFSFTIRANVSGNLMSLVNYSDTVNEYGFYNLFNVSKVVDASNLILPNTVAAYCYQYMFQGCSSLIAAPKLPATTLANYCYQAMFINCTSLTTAPKMAPTTVDTYCCEDMFANCTALSDISALTLPATTLANWCYYDMFYGCTSLTTAPELPATTLATCCYYWMFYGCTSLNYIKCLATDLTASLALSGWVTGVSSTGTFVKAKGIEWTTGTSGIPDGWTVEEIGHMPENLYINGDFNSWNFSTCVSMTGENGIFTGQLTASSTGWFGIYEYPDWGDYQWTNRLYSNNTIYSTSGNPDYVLIDSTQTVNCYYTMLDSELSGQGGGWKIAAGTYDVSININTMQITFTLQA